MVRSIQIPRYGGPEVFRLVESESQTLTPDGVRIRVAAAGVNFADLMMRMGTYPEAPPRPFTPGYEVAGTVIEAGPEVKRLKIGDRVLAGTRFGGYTTEIVLPESQVWKTPSRLTDVEAAAIPVNFLTAWLALEEMARVRDGDHVLIQSAAGGVGTAAIQIARLRGATITGLTSSPRKIQAIRDLGATEVLLQQEWDELSDDKASRFDVILDSIGGRSLKRSFRRLAPAGRVVHFGVSGMIGGNTRSVLSAIKLFAQTPLYHPLYLMKENKGIFGINVLQLFDPRKQGFLMRDMDLILKRFEQGDFRVVIGKTFPLEEAGAAHACLQSRASIGKVILVCHPSG